MTIDLLASYMNAGHDAVWAFDEASGATLNDRSGNGHNGSYVGSPTLGATGVDLDSATALNLPNNIANYGTIPYGAWMDRTGNFSVSCWFNTTSAGNQYIIQRWQGGGSTQCWGMDLQSSDVCRYYAQFGGANSIVSLTHKNLRDGLWHLMVMEWDGTNWDMMMDGRLVQRSTPAGGAMNTTSGDNIYIGRREPAEPATQWFNGSLAKATFGPAMGQAYWLQVYKAGVRKRTRWYFPASTTQAMTPAYHTATWDVTASATRRLMTLEKTNTAMAATAVSDTAATGVEDVLHRQYIATNNPFTRDGILSGTFTFSCRSTEANAAADAYQQLVIKVVDPSGTIRGSAAFAGHTLTTVSATAGAINQELPTGSQSRYLMNVALTDTPYNAGDILVVELGVRYTDAIATIYSSGMRLGDVINTFEHVVQENLTEDRVPWIEFSQELPVVPSSGWGIAA